MPEIFLSYNRKDQAALGRTGEAQEAVLRARKAALGEGLDYWTSFVRGTYISERMFKSFSQHFIGAWNATPLEAGA